MTHDVSTTQVSPDVGTILQQTVDEYGKNIGPYALAGLGHLLYSVPVVLISIVALYVSLLIGIFGTVIASAGVATAMPRDLEAIGAIVASVGTVGVFFLILFTFVLIMNMLMAPVNASLMRAIAKQQRGEEQLSIASPFNTALQDLVPVLGAVLVMGVLTLVLSLFCLIPALLVPLLFSFAHGLIALNRTGVIEALKSSAAHARENLGWHAFYLLIHWALSMVANNVPVLGPTFMAALQVRATQALFGDAGFESDEA